MTADAPAPTVAPPEAAPAPLLLDVHEVAALLGVSARHVQALHRSGRLPAPVRLGRRVLWNRLQLVRWCEAGCPGRERWLAMEKSKTRGGAT